MVESPEEVVSLEQRKHSVKESRAYIDGAFDLVHSGHFNAIRQAYALCDELVIGANSDEDIEVVKGPTVFNVHERTLILKACKWAT